MGVKLILCTRINEVPYLSLQWLWSAFHNIHKSMNSLPIYFWYNKFVLTYLWLASYNVASVETSFNSLAPGISLSDFIYVIFNLALLIGIFNSSYDNVRRWMPQDLTNDKSKLVQVMAWYRQATSHNLNQCWPRSPTPCGVTRPQWVNSIPALVQIMAWRQSGIMPVMAKCHPASVS